VDRHAVVYRLLSLGPAESEEIPLQIQDRRTIEGIDTLYFDYIFLDGDNVALTDADEVGPERRMRGEYTCSRVVPVSPGMDLQDGSLLRSVVLVKPIDDVNIRVSLKTL